MIGQAIVMRAAVEESEDPVSRLGPLFDTHHQRLYRLARRLARQGDDAHDLVQETFLRAARSPRSLQALSRAGRAVELLLFGAAITSVRPASGCAGRARSRWRGEARAPALQLHLTARSAPTGIQTRFVLVAQDARASHSDDHAEAERLLKNAKEDLATMELRVSEARQRLELGTGSPLEVREMQDKATQMRREVEALGARLERSVTGGEAGVVDSSFTMAPGETVVVGTSRLGGDKALIALVTAVPKGTK